MRDQMQVGDGVLFYASNADPSGRDRCRRACEGRVSRSLRVEKGHNNTKYFDARSTKSQPLWYMVDIGFVERFGSTVSLDTLKSTTGLESMVVTKKGGRLSVQPATKKEFDIVVRLGRRSRPSP